MYLNIVWIMHEEQDLSNPLNNWELNAVKMGIQQSLRVPPKQKLPITIEILRFFYRNLDLNIPQLQSCWRACLIAFFPFLRKSTFLPRSAIHIDTQKALGIQDFPTDYSCYYISDTQKQSSLGKEITDPHYSCRGLRSLPCNSHDQHAGKPKNINSTTISDSVHLCYTRRGHGMSDTQFICEHTEIHTFTRWSGCISGLWPFIQEGRLLLSLSAGFTTNASQTLPRLEI